jgi:hypothetical protein
MRALVTLFRKQTALPDGFRRLVELGLKVKGK